MEKTSNNRHGKRANGIKVVSIPMSIALREQIRELAERDGRPLAAWVRFQMSALVRRSLAARKAA